MIRIAICDDEQKILDEVSACVKRYAEKKCRNVEVVCFPTASLLISAIEDYNDFDIFILDVYIGNDIGISLARAIRKIGIESPIVFLTSSVEHAPESFESDTLRYLIKPLNVQKFYEAMDVSFAKAEKLGERLIKLKTDSGVESVNANRITYSEAHGHYQYVSLEDGTQLRVRMTVTELFEMLMGNGGFVSVGRAYIVNLRYVKNITATEIHLYQEHSIPIPRGKCGVSAKTAIIALSRATAPTTAWNETTCDF